MVSLKYDFIPVDGLKRTGQNMAATTLTIHSTANLSSTAQNERNNLARVSNRREASFHYVVDDKEAICCIPPSERAKHAGSRAGNDTSLSLEICESGNREKTIKNAVELTAVILKERGWGIERLRQHHDWQPTKNCPRILRTGNLWQEFKERVEKEMSEIKTGQTAIDYLVKRGIINSPSYWYKVLDTTRDFDLFVIKVANALN